MTGIAGSMLSTASCMINPLRLGKGCKGNTISPALPVCALTGVRARLAGVWHRLQNGWWLWYLLLPVLWAPQLLSSARLLHAAPPVSLPSAFSIICVQQFYYCSSCLVLLNPAHTFQLHILSQVFESCYFMLIRSSFSSQEASHRTVPPS
jgi:hypothetical protein